MKTDWPPSPPFVKTFHKKNVFFLNDGFPNGDDLDDIADDESSLMMTLAGPTLPGSE